jgi:hypothetical protein
MSTTSAMSIGADDLDHLVFHLVVERPGVARPAGGSATN